MISLGDVGKAALWVTTVETGTFVCDPAPSRWGVSLAYHQNLTEADIAGMTQDRAAGILGSGEYWLPAWNALPQFLAIPMLAFSVLEGPTWAARTLQTALGVTVDGDVGPATVAAAQAAAARALDPLDGLLRRLVEAQTGRLQQSPRAVADLKGWVGRCSAAAMAAAVGLASK